VTEPAFLIRVGALPRGSDQRDALELILAAVSLDLQAKVLISPDALELFEKSSGSGWRQLIEQDLVDVRVLDASDASEHYHEIEQLSPNALKKLLADCTLIEL
jgi:hypothetical protein